MEAYLQVSNIIDWQHLTILELAETIASQNQTIEAIAKASFEWVRDRVSHSCDSPTHLVTYRASDVLAHNTGLCYAKSHLLAGLLRANGIPAGFCYQRLSIDDRGPPYSLHGFNAVFLPHVGWYRIDARGNRPGIDAQFDPPREQLAYTIKIPGEVDRDRIFPKPLPLVITTLQYYSRLNQLLDNLPDLEHW